MLALLLRWFTFRHIARARLRYLTIVATIALGVASFLSIKIASRASVQSFGSFTEAISDGSDFTIAHEAGNFPADYQQRVRQLLDPLPVLLFPTLQYTGLYEPTPESRRTLTLLGVDLVALRNLTQQNSIGGIELGQSLPEETEFIDVLNRRDLIYLTEAFARQEKLSLGDPIRLIINDRYLDLRVDGIIRQKETAITLPANLAIFDLKTLAHLAGIDEKITRIEGIIPPGASQEQNLNEAVWRLENGLERGLFLHTGDSSAVGNPEGMTRAFRLNLFILSLIALLVGLYLIVQALDAAVVERRPEIATLRSLGITTSEVRILFLFESILLGVVGSAFGILLGYALSFFTVTAVRGTINSLYTQTAEVPITLTYADVIPALGIGILASIIAGIIPANDAAKTPPAQQLSRGFFDQGITLFQRPLLGLIPLSTAIIAAQFPPLLFADGGSFPLAGYTAAILWLIGISIFSGWFLKAVGIALPPLTPPLYLAKKRLSRPTGRHRLATAGLTIAVAMAAAMLILVGSFEETMRRWVSATINGDIYLSPPAFSGASNATDIPATTISEIRSHHGIQSAEAVLIRQVTFRGSKAILLGQPLNSPTREDIWIDPPTPGQRIMPGGTAVEPVYISEPFARRYRLSKDQLLTLPTPYGYRQAIVVGIYAEYGNDSGTIMVDYETMAEWYNTDSATRITLSLAPGQDRTEILEQLKTTYPTLNIRDNNELRAEIFRIFRATFSVTYGLQLISITVAIAGLGLALAALAMETRQQTDTLRAIGTSKSEITRLFTCEGTGIALAGVLGGLLSSLALGWLLVYVINVQSFGWTLILHLPALKLLLLILTIMATAALTTRSIGKTATRYNKTAEKLTNSRKDT